MRVDFLTIFPGMFSGVLDFGLIYQARQKGILDFGVHDLRNFTHDRHRSVDDVAYGGGPGMVFKPEPVFEALDDIRRTDSLVVLPSPQGELFTQKVAEDLAIASHLIFVCARYEGVDERVCEAAVNREISIGDFVVMGGELPALIMVEAIARLIPGVVGDATSIQADSFQPSLLDHPHYTRPDEYRGMKVPAVLLSGHHEQIRKWRRKQALQRTMKRRPDLFTKFQLTEEDRELLKNSEFRSQNSE